VISPAPQPRDPLQLLSVVIPARNEEGSILTTVQHLHDVLGEHDIPHEILVVDDGSDDRTLEVLQNLSTSIPALRPLHNAGPNGFGRAVTFGLDHMNGDAVAIVMGDESDDPNDLVQYWEKLNEGFDCVFGSRFIKGGGTVDYPKVKLLANRTANLFIRVLFATNLNDTTNAFKAYRKEIIDACHPLISHHFNLTVELPLKAMIRGGSWTIVPITWRNRTTGMAKLKIKEMGSRYLFVVLYLWLEKSFSQGDYRVSKS
jgi:dolichol-phosphate mannosyltransferase